MPCHSEASSTSNSPISVRWGCPSNVGVSCHVSNHIIPTSQRCLNRKKQFNLFGFTFRCATRTTSGWPAISQLGWNMPISSYPLQKSLKYVTCLWEYLYFVICTTWRIKRLCKDFSGNHWSSCDRLTGIGDWTRCRLTWLFITLWNWVCFTCLFNFHFRQFFTEIFLFFILKHWITISLFKYIENGL